MSELTEKEIYDLTMRTVGIVLEGVGRQHNCYIKLSGDLKIEFPKEKKDDSKATT